MPNWLKMFNLGGKDRLDGDRSAYSVSFRGTGLDADKIEVHLLSRAEGVEDTFPAEEVTKVALRLKYQIEQVVPCELEESRIRKANSPIITRKVLKTAKEAGGKEYESCVIFCLLVCMKWFKRRAKLELWDADLYQVRAVACEMIAKHLIEGTADEDFMMEAQLLKRFSVMIDGKPTVPANVIEKAVDLHAITVIGSAGYQKVIRYLWRGWLMQDDLDPSKFVPYRARAKTAYWVHFDPDRMRTPMYQNLVQIGISIIYLALFTIAINTINRDGDVDIIEGILYLFTAGFLLDEATKFFKIGWNYIGFWNVFNLTLYGLLCVSFITRMIALGHQDEDDPERVKFNRLSYNFLAFSAPMFWMRILLFLDNFNFFGSMLVVLRTMMKESLIFFALLILICIGFLQSFISMDVVEDNEVIISNIIKQMLNAVMQSPEFDFFEHNYSPPFGIILFYIFTFIIMIILLNILIALFNSAYEGVTEESDDEYMALFAQKTMQFVRAPDSNVFIAPFNLIEISLLILPFEWWMDSHRYERLSNYVMGVIYSPLLLVTAWFESYSARHVLRARARDEADEDRPDPYAIGLPNGVDLDYEADGWVKKVDKTKPNVETDTAVLEIRELRDKVSELTNLIQALSKNLEK